MDILESSLSILPKCVSGEIGIPYYKPEDYKISYVNRLKDEYKHIYSDYNSYANNVHKMAELIYRFQFINFRILYEQIIRSFVVSYSVIQKDYMNDEKTYKLSSKTRENVTRVVGLPFEQIVSMKPDDLEKYIDETLGIKQTQRDVRTMEQAEEKMDKIIFGSQLILKKNNN